MDFLGENAFSGGGGGGGILEKKKKKKKGGGEEKGTQKKEGGGGGSISGVVHMEGTIADSRSHFKDVFYRRS